MLYQKLIQDDVGIAGGSDKTNSYAMLARKMGVPSTSVHEWATYSHNRIPTYKSLEKIAAYFKLPVPVLLMESDTPLPAIVIALYRADQQQLESICKTLGIQPCP